MVSKTCIDLFAGRGGFSSAFHDHPDWNVVTVDINPDHNPDICADIRDLDASDDRLPNDPDVILASPPCTEFSKAAAWKQPFNDDGDPVTDAARDAFVTAMHCVGLIHGLNPEYYVIENPEASRLQHALGPPDARITYCQYGTPYRKATWFWGELPRVDWQYCPPGGDCHDGGSLTDDTDDRPLPRDPAARAEIPTGVSAALRRGIDEHHEQQELTAWQPTHRDQHRLAQPTGNTYPSTPTPEPT
ncbi:DNA cytosine methyltransferase [Halorubrum halodurans]|uniref:DNA methyltransferase n=1 Tax=Halorubrum halodurans TaxID=1383851 RepID=A0A256IJE5_9EURY|nr:DNA cytosine methyltransferase [Halorubrum halodurans]OYR56645.1 hypothetical protein DJ70_07985 [Halorubrum halodurans]